MSKEDWPVMDYDVIVDIIAVESNPESSPIEIEMNDHSLCISEDVILPCVNSSKPFYFVNKSLECNFDAARSDEFDLNSVTNLDKSLSENDIALF
jgi:hypothetical protein